MPRISPATFAAAYDRFTRAVEAYPYSPGPFIDFQSGLAADGEHYKEWLYLEARRQLNTSSWKENWIGTGRILDRVISAIEIHQDTNYRNNIVEWGDRRGEKAKSHKKILDLARSAESKQEGELAFYQMYVANAASEGLFMQLVRLFGARYDLISYLFFLRDWTVFMPVRSTIFPKAFEELGVPHKMSHKCTWENYSEFLALLREVQKHLATYDIPGGVRLVDAHSFCWMLASPRLRTPSRQYRSTIRSIVPRRGNAPGRSSADTDFSLGQLMAQLRQQKWIGDLAQAVVLKAERDRLVREGRGDLAQLVEDISDNVSLGYDIASFTTDGQTKPIEVKAAARIGNDLRFFFSEKERSRSLSMPNYTFALVLDVNSASPKISEFSGKQLPPTALHPIAYEVRIRE